MFQISEKAGLRTAVFAVSALVAMPALAHSGGDHVHGFAAGFAHPFSGLDHLLAMLAVGLWAAQHKRSAVWLLPLVFPLMMILGAVAGVYGMQLPGVEAGISGSVVVLGLLIAFAVRMPVWASAALVSTFALAHGHAHGIELPKDVSPVLYCIGFVAATFVLHLIGLAVGLAAGQRTADKVVRLIGAGIAATGAFLLAGLA
ncbi:urease accessory protein [Noviherbaspirillum cavernae]|uniref:Urease accessory protein n=1 Tax=Noviherbaspirillum cavernae TaxID=2320862 RepID=A0A418X2B1_9BURK|nr:HupE/UreJ family protein [Noviherbaspirillum cavernae]RJG06583.1 urease accessory protein [Noviherbaspirillum cavernae]